MATHWKILIGLLVGIAVGLLINAGWTEETWASQGVRNSEAFLAFKESAVNRPTAVASIARLAVRVNQFIGDLFVRLLRFAAVPIVLFTLIAGVASLGDPRQLGRLGLRTIGIYLGTTVFAVVLGLVIANALSPGRFVPAAARDALIASQQAEAAARTAQVGQVRGVWDQVLAIVPRNPFEAMASGDLLAVIFFAVAIGLGLTLLPPARARPAIETFGALGDAVAMIVHIIMKAAPVAVFCLIVPVAAGLGWGVIKALGVFCASFLGGLAVLLLVEYPLLVRLLGGMRPGDFQRGIAPAQLVAFTSSSSSATLPVTMDCVTKRLGVPPRIAGFVLPLGATVNMDGTAMYQAMVTVFVAQAFGVELSLSQQVAVVFAATLASIGSPGIPSGGIVMLIAILQSVGLPAEGIALILGVDRILDMCRTVTNVSGDAAAAVIVSRGQREPPALAD